MYRLILLCSLGLLLACGDDEPKGLKNLTRTRMVKTIIEGHHVEAGVIISVDRTDWNGYGTVGDTISSWTFRNLPKDRAIILPPYPNPAFNDEPIYIPLSVPYDIYSYDLDVLDGGRDAPVLRSLHGKNAPANYLGSTLWDWTDGRGHSYGPGSYTIRLRTRAGQYTYGDIRMSYVNRIKLP